MPSALQNEFADQIRRVYAGQSQELLERLNDVHRDMKLDEFALYMVMYNVIALRTSDGPRLLKGVFTGTPYEKYLDRASELSDMWLNFTTKAPKMTP